VTDPARAVGISVRQLQYAFVERFGSTPAEMLRDIRLAQAHQLLPEIDPKAAPTVAAVAHHCGFTRLSRFAIAYRDRFGESPSETVRRVRGLSHRKELSAVTSEVGPDEASVTAGA
jgi:transcriptional regulator GlxA family with amidase domain